MSRKVKSTLSVVASKGLHSKLTYTRASQATRTSETGLVELVSSGEIRLDYEPGKEFVGTHIGWLLEEASRNNLLHSEDFTSEWDQITVNETNIGSVTSDSTRSPDGSNNADFLKATAGTGIVAVKQSISFNNWSRSY